ncbi:uncharacterized protein LOC136090771 isoform X2 [Hydra vulgaris]|uniref:Uncharacterized protein LOC136090771 isoform X2 n=1 Tax=Hydra vulgaris TaxID=6087 RepID=A0ABM4DGZ1_HYDVU
MGGVNAGELLMKALYDEKLYLFLHSCGIADLKVKKETMDQTELVPRSNSPHLCVYGNSLFTANRFMLVIDCIVVFDGMNNFIKSFCCLFASFYIFNIPYPKEASSILEFC